MQSGKRAKQSALAVIWHFGKRPRGKGICVYPKYKKALFSVFIVFRRIIRRDHHGCCVRGES
jgi:hypothetical protein